MYLRHTSRMVTIATASTRPTTAPIKKTLWTNAMMPSRCPCSNSGSRGNKPYVNDSAMPRDGRRDFAVAVIHHAYCTYIYSTPASYLSTTNHSSLQNSSTLPVDGARLSLAQPLRAPAYRPPFPLPTPAFMMIAVRWMVLQFLQNAYILL